MIRSCVRSFAAALVAAAAILAGAVTFAGTREPVVQQRSSGWQLPPDAAETKSPLSVDAKVLEAGKKVFLDKCKKCHGPNGLGDGPDADPDHAEEMNLTNPKRADRNPDGVVFHKVRNGRSRPKMPSFKDELSTDQIWSVVAYVQSLRKKS